ncbi:MAG: hypothetical protein J1F32_06570 [Erysipelotrichales bacterium]|nr:hypothetical protein [Erysipelotrichales bacterium]
MSYKQKYRSKITIYQLPLITRIMVILSSLGLTFIAIFGIIISDETPLIYVYILLVAAPLDCVLTFFLCFKTYIQLDIKNKQLIIREFPGFKKNIIYIYDIIEILFVDDSQYKWLFTIDIVCVNYVKIINSWSMGPGSWIPAFNRYKRQKRRLLKFTYECNKTIKTMNPTINLDKTLNKQKRL